MTSRTHTIRTILQESRDIKTRLLDESVPAIEASAALIINTLKSGRKVLICGNGGSAADSQHFAAELVGRFQSNRRALPAVALSTDTSSLTAIGNDFGFEEVFRRQVEALGAAGDLLVGISSSGSSTNVIRAMVTAKILKMRVLALVGGSGGPMAREADAVVCVPSENTARIQEGHITVIHILCDLVERELFPEAPEK